MQKRLLYLLVILSICGTADGQVLTLGLKSGYFTPRESIFKEMYGSGLSFGGRVELTLADRFSIWMGVEYFSQKGYLSFTREETRVEIIPFDFGIRYYYPVRWFIPYIGSALRISEFTETNPIGTAEQSRVGYVGEAGVLVGLSGPFQVDLRVSYISCTVDPDDFGVNIGGLCISTGFRFNIPLRSKDARRPWYRDYFDTLEGA